MNFADRMKKIEELKPKYLHLNDVMKCHSILNNIFDPSLTDENAINDELKSLENILLYMEDD